MCWGDIRPQRSNLRVIHNRLNGLLQNSAVGDELCFPPGLQGVLQDIGKILFRLGREDQAQLRG
jgi:hypothetical protein